MFFNQYIKTMKTLISTIFMLVIITPSFAQQRKLNLNVFTGVAGFKNYVTPIEGDEFKASKIYSAAPSGVGLGLELIKNTFINAQFGVQSLHNDYLSVQGEWGGVRSNNSAVLAFNYGINLRYEISLAKALSFSPFIGYSRSHIRQPESSSSPLIIRLKTESNSYVNGVLTNSQRDSLYSSTSYISNRYSGFTFGGQLAYQFKNKLGIYVSYSLFYNTKNYATVYGEFRSTATSTQKAFVSFGQSGHFYQIGFRYHLFDIKKGAKP